MALNVTQVLAPPKTSTGLVPSDLIVRPGSKFMIALHMKMAPGWHSYYLNPGESGQATSIKWHLPPGFTTGPIRWPTPKRIVVSDVAGYVYEGDAWLITEVSAPKNLSVGRSVQISAEASWLLCREACFPQSSHLSVNLKTGSAIASNPDFVSARSTLVPPLQGKAPRAFSKGGPVTVKFDSPGATANDVQFFPSDPTYFGADLIKAKATPEGLELSIPISKYAPHPPKFISGILVAPDGMVKGTHWVSTQVMNL